MSDDDDRPTREVDQDLKTIRNETLRLASMGNTIEAYARIETLLWVLGHIDTDYCPTGEVDRERIRNITDRGPWPFDPSLPEVDNAE